MNELKYAVVAVNRSTGDAHTIEVLTDSARAQREAGRLDRTEPMFRHSVVVYLDADYTGGKNQEDTG